MGVGDQELTDGGKEHAAGYQTAKEGDGSGNWSRSSAGF
jgi:hypothetical protein